MPSEVFVGFLQDQVEILKEKVAALEAENERLKQKFESMRRINDANLESYNNCSMESRVIEEERDALKEQVAKLGTENTKLKKALEQLLELTGALGEEGV